MTDAARLQAETSASAGSTASLREDLQAELAKAVQDAEAKAAADAADGDRKLSSELETVKDESAAARFTVSTVKCQCRHQRLSSC